MGNSGFKKIFFPGDIVENKYSSAYEINVVSLDKKEIPLSTYKDKVCLVVNVSSQSKDSPNELKNLKNIHEKFASRGFEILAFPCDQFANEPGNFKTIKSIYNKEYEVNFPVFSKVEVNGEYTSPIYKFLKKNSSLYNIKLLNSNPIKEDFCRFLIDKKGQVVSYHEKGANIESLSQEIEKALDERLDTPTPKGK